LSDDDDKIQQYLKINGNEHIKRLDNYKKQYNDIKGWKDIDTTASPPPITNNSKTVERPLSIVPRNPKRGQFTVHGMPGRLKGNLGKPRKVTALGGGGWI
jgi:hypothetical protein